MPCTKNDPECLRKAATHIAHDVRMLREAWRQQSDPLAYTAWFIHCRSVMDFFAGVGMDPDDDIYAWHYFPKQSDWDDVRDKITQPAEYQQYRKAVAKLAAHLTYSRIDYAEEHKLSPSLALTEYLLGLAGLFLRLLPPERVAWFGGLSL